MWIADSRVHVHVIIAKKLQLTYMYNDIAFNLIVTED